MTYDELSSQVHLLSELFSCSCSQRMKEAILRIEQMRCNTSSVVLISYELSHGKLPDHIRSWGWRRLRETRADSSEQERRRRRHKAEPVSGKSASLSSHLWRRVNSLGPSQLLSP
jgi:hypothetical protein